MQELKGKRVAILATHGFEQSELEEPRRALATAGAHVDVVSPVQGQIRGWSHGNWGKEVPVDVELWRAGESHYDGLVLPGGVLNPDALRMMPTAVDFVSGFVLAQKPIAAICHGPWLLINAGAARGRRMTSWPSLQADLENAGAHWVDQDVVVDRGIVTSRKPGDLPRFIAKTIEAIGGRPQERRAAAPPA